MGDPVRTPHLFEREAIATLWHAAWHDSHAELSPQELIAERDFPSFLPRVDREWTDLRIAGPFGAPTGLCITAQDQLSHLFLDTAARGTGLAEQLVMDAKARIAANGHQVAWLSCAVGNIRAARFYEKQGWVRATTHNVTLNLRHITLTLPAWRYEKQL
ncbi:Acetyltransferase (GNAT) domain-containing protein [Monaibacterium marinum]|uniref:Acetyltransferase (GNAT) domain-containing protein n=1 Tax=Pontivivens marinum TaxID=1690039 RepID=A0A2C9CQZ3_9RHOB|nr:GNAT family N-acetyltransferase [Monaibacterium marinum]SOH93633.1 Acetyltransferase (GNAT) domain-containing protein [Monaibacterium marinum]